jgi:hypothetical protein
MPVVVYLDETGDHSLEVVDQDFSVFVLCCLICETEQYADQIVPAFLRLKFEYFGHEAVILHSRDIRKAQGAFGFLTDPAKRQVFYERLNQIMATCDYTLIATAIRKQKHTDRYGRAARNPYDLAFTFALERLLPLLEGLGQTDVQLIAEARGKREDAELRLAFLMNVIGIQIADLAGYPVARYVLNPARPSEACNVIRAKFYKGPGWVQGLKIFP